MLPSIKSLLIQAIIPSIFHCRFSIFCNQCFLSQTMAIHRTAGESRDHLLFHSIISTLSWTFRHSFSILYVRWFSYLSSHYLYLPDCYSMIFTPYWITIWLIDDWMLFLFVYLMIWFTGNQWIWTRIDYHSCITSEPTRQMCQSPQIEYL